jgi:magnesium transporter
MNISSGRLRSRLAYIIIFFEGLMEPRFREADLNDPVTKHMHGNFTCLQVHQTVGEALAWLRTHPPEGRIIYFYVVDQDNRLQGVMPTRRLVLNDPARPLGEIMVRRVVTLPEDATVLDACDFFITHRFLALPVVDRENHLLGQVDVELYTRELVHLGDTGNKDELFQLIGVHLTQAMQRSSLAAFWSRLPWLGCNMAAGLLAAFLSGWFQDVLSWNQAVLALFIPVVLALAESVSIQSVSLTLETLQGQKPTWALLLGKLRREWVTGLLLGIATGLTVGLVAWVWQGEWRVMVCLLGGITGGVTVAALLGMALPYIMRLLQKDPQVAAGPIALAAADMVTLTLYFSLGQWLQTF